MIYQQTDFVWYGNVKENIPLKVWLKRPGHRLANGRIALTDLKDHSLGVNAIPELIRPINEETYNGIVYFLHKGDKRKSAIIGR